MVLAMVGAALAAVLDLMLVRLRLPPAHTRVAALRWTYCTVLAWQVCGGENVAFLFSHHQRVYSRAATLLPFVGCSMLQRTIAASGCRARTRMHARCRHERTDAGMRARACIPAPARKITVVSA